MAYRPVVHDPYTLARVSELLPDCRVVQRRVPVKPVCERKDLLLDVAKVVHALFQQFGADFHHGFVLRCHESVVPEPFPERLVVLVELEFHGDRLARRRVKLDRAILFHAESSCRVLDLLDFVKLRVLRGHLDEELLQVLVLPVGNRHRNAAFRLDCDFLRDAPSRVRDEPVASALHEFVVVECLERFVQRLVASLNEVVQIDVCPGEFFRDRNDVPQVRADDFVPRLFVSAASFFQKLALIFQIECGAFFVLELFDVDFKRCLFCCFHNVPLFVCEFFTFII